MHNTHTHTKQLKSVIINVITSSGLRLAFVHRIFPIAIATRLLYMKQMRVKKKRKKKTPTKLCEKENKIKQTPTNRNIKHIISIVFSTHKIAISTFRSHITLSLLNWSRTLSLAHGSSS